jgi:hypothetical protein
LILQNAVQDIHENCSNLNKQYILNPSDSLNKDMEKTEMELKILREKKAISHRS